ncbi:MAG: ATP synthase subunit alpha [candidate division TM6 bacterium GW2011_GWF2_37_49]|nr:MAG: ATP synthase subunit alpha [candidate division TM6 bacterium GW2011_GWF2_37_49]
MTTQNTDLISLLEKALSQQPQDYPQEVGTVIKVGDGICKIFGLNNAVLGEIIEFESGGKGIILDLDEDFVSVALLEEANRVLEQDTAMRTGKVFSIPVGDKLQGRVISAIGKPLDGFGPIHADKQLPIEHSIPGIIDRSLVNQSLETGITAIDSLFPIGRGQRELFIGDRGTGKTSLVIDTILHQKNSGVICIYVSIGHKQANIARLTHLLEKNDALDYTIIVDANAKETPLNQYLAPYSGCTIGEYFMNQGKDVLIVYDDLSKHAIAYRELSLLLKRPPGREAYPGDIFYIHSRLLERAGKLSLAHGGGSITALPIIQTQEDDISGYIPTNLISITDGQIILDTNLFNGGIQPAVNVGLSVSRVGKVAQTKAMREVSGSLKLELAQYYELLAFSQFGSELDKSSQKALDRGRRAIEILKQPEHETYSFVDQVIFLFLLKEHYLNKLEIDKIKDFVVQLASYIQGAYNETYSEILKTKELSQANIALFKKAADEFSVLRANKNPV